MTARKSVRGEVLGEVESLGIRREKYQWSQRGTVEDVGWVRE